MASIEQEQNAVAKLEPLKKGEYVILQVEVANCPMYPFNFVVAQLIGDVAGLDTSDPDTKLNFQVYRPATLTNLASKIVPWIGDTNKPWKEEFT